MDEYVWLKSEKVDVGARVLDRLDFQIQVLDDDNQVKYVTPEEIRRPMHPASITPVDDMIVLGDLQDCTILRNLQLRYNKHIIYTYIGNILVAINPYKTLAIYGEDNMREYRKKRLDQLPPHVFAVADNTFEAMQRNCQKTCVVISGESGSGKTETTKYFLQYLAHLGNNNPLKVKQILDSNPILEAFGNAKTESNDNSSRFGKYIVVHFDADGTICSAKINHYLLEKSRVVTQGENEQNYHIFYMLLNGLSKEELGLLRLDQSKKYNYLNTMECEAEERIDMSEIQKMETIKSKMNVLGFSESEIWKTFELISAILNIGQISFRNPSEAGTDPVEITSTTELIYLTKLLGVEQNELTDALTKKKMVMTVPSNSVIKILRVREAEDTRDAFAKRIYINLFNFIVRKITEILKDDGTGKWYIGILDIYGFEKFETNSFEQFCINYANEKLQQLFINHVFKAEQEQYLAENIEWRKVDYTDNADILKMLENGSLSLLSIIDDESKFPFGTDEDILDKANERHSENTYFLKSKFRHTCTFGIKHYAGVVDYNVKGWVEKNQDACSLSIKGLIEVSQNTFLKEIFKSDLECVANFEKRTETLIYKFRNSLDSLVKELSECQPFFVRCIKPNTMKKPNVFDRDLCFTQLRHSGMTETVKIREAGYPVRYDYFEFVDKFRALCPHVSPSSAIGSKETTMRICTDMFQELKEDYCKFGSSKVFLKHVAESILEVQNLVIQEDMRRYPEFNENQSAIILNNIETPNEISRNNDVSNNGELLSHDELLNCAEISSIDELSNNGEIPNEVEISIIEKPLEYSTETYYFEYLIARLQAWCRGYLTRNCSQRLFCATSKIAKANQLRNEELKPRNHPATFQTFAEKYFQNKQTSQFSTKPVKTPLLRSVEKKYTIPCEALWTTILKFLGNLGESKNYERQVPAKTNVRQILSQIRNRLAHDEAVAATTGQNLKELYDLWLAAPSTNLEKLEFIVFHGIERPELRDEIYCEICKAVSKNPIKKAAINGWDLLSSCTGCFPPSDLFLPYLKSFIREGPKNYVSYSLFRLHRTIQNGERTQPPCYTEFKAIQEQKQLKIKVYLSNGLGLPIKIDSAMTAKELLDAVAKSAKLEDTFGFSIVLGHDLKHLSLGDGSDFVMDFVAQCEQYALEMGDDFTTLPWKMYLKKEMFAPWHDCRADEVSTGLICAQIADGVRAGEYECDPRATGHLVAQICFVQHGKVPLPTLKRIMKEYIPHYIYSFSPEKVDLVEEKVRVAYLEMFLQNSLPEESVRESLIKFAIQQWPLQFSRFFHVTGSLGNEKSLFSYPEVPLVVAVNSRGIIVMDEVNEKKIIIKLHFMEIKDLIRKEVAEGKGYILIKTYYGTEITFLLQSQVEDSLYELLQKITDSLKKFSKFVMATENFETLDTSFLSLKKGDLVILSDRFKGEYLLENSWAEGLNVRNGQNGNVLLESVKIVPTIERPSEAILKAMTNESLAFNKRQVDKLKYYVLDNYAGTYFTPQDSNLPCLWKFSLEKLQRPLHHHLAGDENLTAAAIQSYQIILQYIEGNPSSESEKVVQIAEKLFGPPIKNEKLRDEIYCQILKQLTSNPDRSREDRAWDLLWMATGLFGCGETLAAEMKKFLLSRRTLQPARECLERFRATSRSGPRAYPPHLIEVEALKHKPSQILHKVNFPDDSHKFFKITSVTKVKHLKEAILYRLKINSIKDFSVCVQIVGRLFVLLENFYIFDYFQLLRRWIEKYNVNAPKWQYQLYFVKQSWKGDIPGDNRMIDLKFIYPQEYNKYIQGYHRTIPPENLPKFAAVLYKVCSENGTIKPSRQILDMLIPRKDISLKKPEEWTEEIKGLCFSERSATKEEKKIEFLKNVHQLPSYGLQFFGMKDKNSQLSTYIFYPKSNTNLIDQ